VRLRARVDANHGEIVACLRQMGASVFDASRMGRGFPDLVCGFRGKTYLVEVKDGEKVKSARKLTTAQVTFREVWRGEPPVTVESVDDVIALLGKG
jgi:Holliday junction resolvase